MIVGPIAITLKDGTPLTLRSPAAADAGIMLDYMRTLLHESSRNMNHWAAGFDAMTDAEEAAVLAKYAADARGFMLSAFAEDGTIVGNIGVFVDGRGRLAHCGTIGMGARVAYHGKGLGYALMQAGMAQAAAAGLWNLRLTVRTFNEPAIRLYEKCGFARVGTLKAVAQVDEGFADEYLYQWLGTPAPERGQA